MTEKRVVVIAPRAARAARVFVAFVAVGFVAGSLPLPWALVAGVAGLGGMVSGIIAWRAVGFAGGTLLRVLIGVGTLASGLLVLSAGSALLIYEEAIAYQRCATEAITVSAQKACETDFEAARDERIAEIERTLERWIGAPQG